MRRSATSSGTAGTAKRPAISAAPGLHTIVRPGCACGPTRCPSAETKVGRIVLISRNCSIISLKLESFDHSMAGDKLENLLRSSDNYIYFLAGDSYNIQEFLITQLKFCKGETLKLSRSFSLNSSNFSTKVRFYIESRYCNAELHGFLVQYSPGNSRHARFDTDNRTYVERE